MKRSGKTDYFTLLERQAAYGVQAARILRDSFASLDPFHLPQTVTQMHAVEREADALRADLTQSLSREFLPPIDREDILSLSALLDDVTDTVEETLRQIYMFNVEQARPDAAALADVVLQSCTALHEAAHTFRDFKKAERLAPRLRAIHALEERSDALYTESVRALYCGTNDPRQLLRWTQIYGNLENCCDVCAHAANGMETVMFKNT